MCVSGMQTLEFTLVLQNAYIVLSTPVIYGMIKNNLIEISICDKVVLCKQ